MQWVMDQWRTWQRARRRSSLRTRRLQATFGWSRRPMTRARVIAMRARAFQVLAVTMVAGLLGGIIVFIGLVAWVANDLPDPSGVQRKASSSTKILDRNGDVLYDVYAQEKRQPVKAEQLPEYLKQATVATEDKDFYRHSGFDPLTPVRMVYNYVFRKGRVVGGSTLTQQLVKNVLLSNERTLTRKLKEFILALEIERRFTKDEILLMYFNETPYGGNAVGVGAASEMFFRKDVSQLTLVESAILAGLPQRPTAYSPFLGRTLEDGTPLWRWRAEGVLRRMREDGYITEDVEKSALEQMKTITFGREQISIRAPHFVFYVLDQLEELYGPDVVQNGGLIVKTTLDLPFQEEAQTIVKEEIDKVKDLNITNGAVVVMDPRNGEVLSMVGSKDYFADDIPGQFNVAVNGLRQPGSSIKPVTYATALKQGMTPATMFVDSFTSFAPNDQADPYEPRNYDGKFRGPMSLRNALGESNNVVAVKLLATVGVKNMLQTATDLGFKTLEPTNDNLKRFGLSVTLGGAEVHLIDSTTAYSAFANGGRQVRPISILEVKDSQEKTLFQHRDVPGKQAIEPEVAYLMNSILSDDIARSGAFGRGSQLNVENRPIAVKTGTTNDQRDNWTVGWSRSTIVGVWVGNNDNSEMKRVASGITGASPIWRRVMVAAIKSGRTTDAWEVPSNVEQARVDAISGYPAHDDLASREEWVIKGTLPTEPDPIHQKVRLCKGQNKLATSVDVQRSNYDEKVFINLYEKDTISQDGRNRWQEGIDAWIAANLDKGTFQAPKDYCDSAGEVVVLMKRPENEKTYNEESLPVEIEVVTEERVDRVELYVDGSLRETLRSKPFTTNVSVPKGRHTLYAKAFRADGKEGKTGDVRIGTGGEDWREPTPAPTPAPTPVPTPVVIVPTATPAPLPTP